MKWNHRLVFFPKEKSVGVMEVFYDADGVPWGYSKAAAIYQDESEGLTPQESIREQLEQMLRATDEPILNAHTDFIGKPDFGEV
jgi:hypothetical protein